jgi:dolichol-phosphate mannosyltransferase
MRCVFIKETVMPKTTVILPTYNEVENLSLMVNTLLSMNIENFNIIIVDDNSPDGTGKVADQLAQTYPAQVEVLHNTNKGGLGPAYKLGFRRAIEQQSEYVIQMDCDFSHPPHFVLDLIAKADEGYDMILGSRYTTGGGVDENWGVHRKFLSWFANRVYVRTILGLPVNDATGGFRLWRRGTLIGMGLDRIHSSGYVFQVEITYVTHRLGYSIAEVPIYFPDRERGESKMGLSITVEAALRIWQMKLRHLNLTPQMRCQDS